MSSSEQNKITIRDIAQAAGVSAPTVSRVLNNYPDVADETRERVLRIIEEMNYRPNRAAQMLHAKRTGFIQILCEEYQGRLHGLGAHAPMIRNAKLRNYRLIFSVVSREDLQTLPRDLEAEMADGLIIQLPHWDGVEDFLDSLSGRVPFLWMGDPITGDHPAILFDTVSSEKHVMQHLIDLGHRDLVVVSSTRFSDRIKVWTEMAKLNDLTLSTALTKDYTPVQGYKAMKILLEQQQHFTGVLVGNDSLASGVMSALREHGYHIPTDVSVVGHDDSPHAAFEVPPLTTARLDYETMGQLAIDYMLSLIENPSTPTYQRTIKTELIIRESTQEVLA